MKGIFSMNLIKKISTNSSKKLVNYGGRRGLEVLCLQDYKNSIISLYNTLISRCSILNRFRFYTIMTCKLWDRNMQYKNICFQKKRGMWYEQLRGSKISTILHKPYFVKNFHEVGQKTQKNLYTSFMDVT